MTLVSLLARQPHRCPSHVSAAEWLLSRAASHRLDAEHIAQAAAAGTELLTSKVSHLTAKEHGVIADELEDAARDLQAMGERG